MKIELLGPLRLVAGKKEYTIRLEGKIRLVEVLKMVDEKIKPYIMDESGNIQPGILVLVNGEDVRFSTWLDTVVDDDDTITLIPSIHGG